MTINLYENLIATELDFIYELFEIVIFSANVTTIAPRKRLDFWHMVSHEDAFILNTDNIINISILFK